MTKSIKGTRTEKNLMTAYVSETQAATRYVYYAETARREGYEQIAGIFMETARNEKAHAEVFFKYLEGGGVEITATFPSGPVADTKSSLERAIAGENMTWTIRYADFAEVANEEGFPKIARVFEGIAVAENHHEERLKRLLDDIIHDEVFKKKAAVTWHCLNCGYVTQGKNAPRLCPACEHPQAFYEVLAEGQ